MTILINAIIGAAAGYGCFILSVLNGKKVEKAYSEIYEQVMADDNLKGKEDVVETARQISEIKPVDPEPKWFFAGFSVVAGAAVCALAPNLLTAVYMLLSLIVIGSIMQTDNMYRKISGGQCLLLFALKILAILIPLAYGGEIRFWHEILLAFIGAAVCALLFLSTAIFGKGAVGGGDIFFAAATGFALGVKGSLMCVVMMGVIVLADGVRKKYYMNIKFLEYMNTMMPMGMALGPAFMIVLAISNATVLLPELSTFMTSLF